MYLENEALTFEVVAVHCESDNVSGMSSRKLPTAKATAVTSSP